MHSAINSNHVFVFNYCTYYIYVAILILLLFTNRKIKEHILRKKKKLKETGVFVNEHLSPKNVDISIFARTLRRQNKIQNTWTRNCKVYIKTNGVPEVSSVLCIKNIIELHKFSN